MSRSTVPLAVKEVKYNSVTLSKLTSDLLPIGVSIQIRLDFDTFY